MAYGRWSSRRYRRYRKYRRFYRSYRRGYARKYVNASSRSSVRMKTSVTTTSTVTAGYGTASTGAVSVGWSVLGGAPANFPIAAAASPLYRTYCSLYEEVKVVGMRVSMAIVDAVGGSDIPSVQIYTAFDRHHGYSEPNATPAEIRESATSSVATALNNNVAKLTRSIYASDLMEKAVWCDCTLDSTTNNANAAWKTAALNPTMFNPQFSFYLNCPTLGATKTISVSLSVVYYFAFRNPRFGGSSSSAKLDDLGARTLPMDEDSDGDMDDAAAAAVPDLPGDMDTEERLEAVRAAEKAARDEAAHKKRTTIVVARPRVRDPKNV